MPDENTTERDPASLLDRRGVLALPLGLACGSLPAGCASARDVTGAAVTSPPPSAEEEVSPPEDLMREHGVLKRVLLIYREGIRRIGAGDQVPARALNAGAGIIRTFIEEYHERLEERYVFPPLVKAGRLTDVVPVLVTQHQRGRVLTGRVLAATRPGTSPDRSRLVADLTAFIRMYEPHEAREDTVVFPALREVVPPREFAEMGERFEDEEHRRFGAAGFTGVVAQVADIEKTLGVYDLNQFTPRT
ncbi:MAG: hemerythrin domain-containing protein [Nonomuraea sp.]|nr:hemerythrin domain-containing protein [Nonomuraea sp.]